MDAADRGMIHILSGTDTDGMWFHQLFEIENFTLKIVRNDHLLVERDVFGEVSSYLPLLFFQFQDHSQNSSIHYVNI